MTQEEKNRLWKIVFDAINEATDGVDVPDVDWTENLVALMTDAAVAVFMASKEQFDAHTRA